MFRKLFRLYNYFNLKAKNDRLLESKEVVENIPLSIKEVKKKLDRIFTQCSDFEMREVIVGDNLKVLLAYIDGITDKKLLNETLLKPLVINSKNIKIAKAMTKTKILEIITKKLLYSGSIRTVKDFKKTIDYILSGSTVLFVDGVGSAVEVDTKGWESRSIQPPETEAVVRGPREGFTETLNYNTAMLRRKIKNPNLKFEALIIGEQTKTNVCICYIKDIANEDIVNTVRRRLKRIKTDAILESGYLEEFIEDSQWSPFPTIGDTERPDKVAAKLLEGRVAIFCDGTPFVLTVPFLFIEAFQSSEDYYTRSLFSMLVRILRIIAFFVSITLPALYVATISFHTNVIPFKLAITMAASREGIPFTPFTEALIMLTVFELLREAGIRMPKPVGQAVNIVGALILGDAAVKASLSSNPMVIVTALTAICSFLITPMISTLLILRLTFLIAANVIGFLGIEMVGLVILVHLCSLRSFGVPYMSPFSPFSGMDLKDTVIKVPIWLMLTRPKFLNNQNPRRSKYRMNIDFRKKED